MAEVLCCVKRNTFFPCLVKDPNTFNTFIKKNIYNKIFISNTFTNFNLATPLLPTCTRSTTKCVYQIIFDAYFLFLSTLFVNINGPNFTNLEKSSLVNGFRKPISKPTTLYTIQQTYSERPFLELFKGSIGTPKIKWEKNKKKYMKSNIKH